MGHHQVTRSWFWGPVGRCAPLEQWLPAPGGRRQVQYFDKSRMEINQPDGDPTSPFYVTNGLLVVEMMSGQMQVGDTRFAPRQPAQINVAGDRDDPAAQRGGQGQHDDAEHVQPRPHRGDRPGGGERGDADQFQDVEQHGWSG